MSTPPRTETGPPAAAGRKDRICPACAERSPVRARFCMGCGLRLRTDEALAAGERREVSVVFADLSGFTSYSERTDPEDVRALVDEAAGGLSQIVDRHGGTVDKIIGDCVMAVFGAPDSHEDDPERAVRASLEMQAYVEENRDRFAGLPLRVGVNTGEAMWAPVGPGGQHTVIGDTVNTAARLQSGAGKGEVYMGSATHDRVADAIECEEVAPLRAKGKEAPLAVFRALRVRGERIVSRRRTALVGREGEMARLWELWERSQTERRPYLVSVLGPSGIGKSRLTRELAARVEGGAAVTGGRCLSYGEGITYWPVMEILRDLAGITHEDPVPVASSKLGELLDALDADDPDELRTMAAAVSYLAGAPTTPRGTHVAEDITKGELHWGIRRVLELAARNAPLLVTFEDVHWAEQTLLELVAFLARAEAPILILATGRPEVRERLSGIAGPADRRRTIEVAPLAERESRELVIELVADLDLSEETLAELIRGAAGNPLFLEELANAVGEVTADEAPALPSSLRGLIAARLDHLPRETRRVAQHASVVGTAFWLPAVERLDEHGDVAAEVAELEQRDIVSERATSTLAGEREWSFKHTVIRDLAYERLPKGRRATLHARFAEWLEELPDVEELLEIRAYHLEQACRLAREVRRSAVPPPVLAAALALAAAGRKAERREGVREAARYYARAVDVLEDAYPETTAELLVRRAWVLLVQGSLDEAERILMEALARVEDLGRPDLRCRALLSLGNIDYKKGRAASGLERLREAERLAGALGEYRLRVRSAFELSTNLAHFAGRHEEALAKLHEARGIARESGEAVLEAEGSLRIGTLLFNLGRFEDAAAEFRRCIEVARGEGSLRHEAWATESLGIVGLYLGDPEAEDLAERSLAWAERIGDGFLLVQNLRALAKIALSRDDHEGAERLLSRALPVAEELGGWLVVEIHRYLAEVHAREDRPVLAREAAAAARAALPGEEAYALAAVLAAEGYAAAAAGDREEARGSFGEAARRMDEQGLPVDAAEVRMGSARFLRAWGEGEAARAELDRARAALVPLGARGALAEIDRVVAA